MRPLLNALRNLIEVRAEHSLRNGFFKGGIVGAMWEEGDNEKALSYLVGAQREIDSELRRCSDKLEELRAKGMQGTMEYRLLMERMHCLKWFNGETAAL